MPQLAPANKQRKRKVLRDVHGISLLREPKKALQLVDNYLSQIDPDDVDLLRLKGNILDVMSEYDRAARLYRRVLQIDPENTLALIDLGDSYSYYRCEYRKAISHYNRALRLMEAGRHHSGLYSYFSEEDEFIEACVGKADALLELNRPLDALKCIVHGLQKYPTDTLLGSALQRAQQRYEALQDRKSSKRYREVKKQLIRLRGSKSPRLR